MLGSASHRGLTMLVVFSVGAVVAASSLGIVRAERTNPNNGSIFRCDQGNACVEGNSTGPNTWGVLGVSRTDGVSGVTASTSGKGGVRGASHGTSGVAYGVIGTSSNGDGVVGAAMRKGDAGVHGFSRKGDGVEAESSGADSVALRALADQHQTYIFFGSNPSNLAQCSIDPNADLSCTGRFRSGSSVQTTHRNRHGERVAAYASESATATIEDVGTARMIGGVAEVRIDPAFAAMMDGRWYYVFLTPLGDTRGLYVSRKAALGFQVRETEHGKANLEFDYRIVAHPVDAPDDRLPTAAHAQAP